MPKSNKTSIARMALLGLATVAAFFVLKFVFSVTMTILKYGVIAALAVFVVWYFLGRNKGSAESDTEVLDRKKGR